MSAVAPPERASAAPETHERLRTMVAQRFERSIGVSTAFFEANADVVANACLAMARRFGTGGRLLAFGSGACATDAQHVAVEFVHPVLVGKRALPAIALTSDVAALTAEASRTKRGFAGIISVLGRRDDIVLAIATGAADDACVRALECGRNMGMLTIALTGGRRAASGAALADFSLVVPTDDPFVVQEVHETAYHVLWELVHVFLDHRAPGDAPRHG